MKKNIVKFFVCLTVIMMFAVSNTPYLAQASGVKTSGFEGKTLVEEITITNEEWLEILESQNFDKEVIDSYKSILNEAKINEANSVTNSATNPLFESKIKNNRDIMLTSVDTSNTMRWYSDGSFELMLNKETLRWIAIVTVAVAVGILAAIPNVGMAVASAVTGVILGYAASTISYGRSFAFVPNPPHIVAAGGGPYKLFGVYRIAGW